MNAFVSTPMMRAFAACIRSNTPAILWGPPGVGKTAKLTSYMHAWNRHLEVVIGSYREASDFLGLPTEGPEGTTEYLTPGFAKRLNDADSGALFLGELSTAGPSIQKAMLRLLQERYAGEEKLGDHVAIFADANPPEQATDGWDLPAPVANRLVHLDWHFDVDEWLDGVLTDFTTQTVYTLNQMLGHASDARRARIKGLVTAFLRSASGVILLNPGPPADDTKAGKAWPSPRSWTNAMTVMSELDPHDDAAMMLVLKGCVGDDAAREFFAWLAVADLHDPADVMADPSIVDWNNERPDRLFALTSGVTALALTRGDAKSWEQAVRALTMCAENGKPDVALPGMRSLLSNMPADAKATKATQAAFGDLFRRTGQWAPAA